MTLTKAQGQHEGRPEERQEGEQDADDARAPEGVRVVPPPQHEGGRKEGQGERHQGCEPTAAAAGYEDDRYLGLELGLEG